MNGIFRKLTWIVTEIKKLQNIEDDAKEKVSIHTIDAHISSEIIL